nr:MAG TPA: hypothetical protein [Caudoviricetes sp.]
MFSNIIITYLKKEDRRLFSYLLSSFFLSNFLLWDFHFFD